MRFLIAFLIGVLALSIFANEATAVCIALPCYSPDEATNLKQQGENGDAEA